MSVGMGLANLNTWVFFMKFSGLGVLFFILYFSYWEFDFESSHSNSVAYISDIYAEIFFFRLVFTFFAFLLATSLPAGNI